MKGNIKKLIPWQIKMALKLFFSFFGATHFLEKTRIFRHGEEENPEKSLRFFKNHFMPAKERAGLKDGFVTLELGPGYSLNTPRLARAFGGGFAYLVDQGKFAKKPQEKPFSMEKPDYQYLTQGLESLKKIPDKSVDFIFSQVVLEHIKKSEFLATLQELRRITKNSGVHSHTIDLKDHLGKGLNHLRFKEKIWESKIFQNSGFYTNRFRFSQMLGFFEKAGFRWEILQTLKFEKVPLERKFMDREFARVSENDLLTEGFHALLFPRN